MSGMPRASRVAGTNSPLASVGYRLGGGGVPFTTQATSARVSARVCSACGFGLTGSVHTLFAAGTASAGKPPRPPPCVVLG